MQDDFRSEDLDTESDAAQSTTEDQESSYTPPRKEDIVVGGPRSYRKLWMFLILVALLVADGAGVWWYAHKDAHVAPVASSTQQAKQSATSIAQGLQLDTTKNYGNKYASGILPVGDGKYSASGAKRGYIYTCSGYAYNIQTETHAGAGSRGPWFTSNNTAYDMHKKAKVQGAVTWQSSFSNTVNGSNRLITSNDLPNHPTGVYPIAASDPAYAYDRNPNGISAQSLSYTLSASPTYNATPNCMGGQSGIMTTGVALFNGFDAGGRDAGAWEVQDNCDGHPEKEGLYHYHTLSSCIKDISVKSVIGYALDGFPITGPQVGPGNILTTADLDECHGITSQVTVGSATVSTYHYVMTQDFPYSVSCFRATPVQLTPPGNKPAPN